MLIKSHLDIAGLYLLVLVQPDYLVKALLGLHVDVHHFEAGHDNYYDDNDDDDNEDDDDHDYHDDDDDDHDDQEDDDTWPGGRG